MSQIAIHHVQTVTHRMNLRSEIALQQTMLGIELRAQQDRVLQTKKSHERQRVYNSATESPQRLCF